jgi:uncharacterized membrane protein YhaH (DUF805 family)
LERPLSNPYQSTTAAFNVDGAADPDSYIPTVFSWTGRIGRVRYIAYTIGVYFTLMFAAGILVTVFGLATGVEGVRMSMGILFAAYLPVIIWGISLTVRRLNDMGHTGWWSIVMLIPVVQFFMWLWLVCGRGDDYRNEYGAIPSENTRGVVFAAWFLPGFFVVGLVAAIVLPAYQQYAKQERAAAPVVDSVQP